MSGNGEPKLFISYSWSTPDHETWVITLATELEQSGIHVILDKWDLHEGQDAYAFMEQMVTDPTIHKVALIFDRVYAEKANARSGGVGTETQILTPELYAKTDQTKFVGVITERDDTGEPYVPAFYKSRMYIDLSDDERYATNFEQLQRWVFDKPLHQRPERGQRPDFLTETPPTSLGTAAAQRRALDAIRQSKPYARGAVAEYFKLVVKNLEKCRITDIGTAELDEVVLASIAELRPIRNEVVEVFLAIALYRANEEAYDQIHGLFEQLAGYFVPTPETHQYREGQFDNFKILVNELFLYCIASFIKHEAFEGVGHLLGHDYLIADLPGRSPKLRSFAELRQYPRSLDAWNARQVPRYLSPVGTVLKERADLSELGLIELMQADVVLYIRSCFNLLRSPEEAGWFPATLAYAVHRDGPLPLFVRAESLRYFQRVAPMFAITGPEEFTAVKDALDAKTIPYPSFGGFDKPDIPGLINYGRLGKRP